MTHAVTTLIPGLTFTEGPRWYDGRFWFVDLYSKRVLSANEDGSDLRTEAVIPQQPSGLGWLPDGRLIVTSMLDRKLMRREHDGTLVVHADLSDLTRGCLCDMVVDSSGRTYTGDFGFDLYANEVMRRGGLYRVDPDGTITQVADDLWFPNACNITDAGELLVNETFGGRITAFDMTEDGNLINRRIWAEFNPLPKGLTPDEAMRELALAPDGGCLDSEGALWVADIKNSRVVRVLEGGTITDEIDPGMMTFACSLGGADGRTLFLCSSPDYVEGDRKADPQSRIGVVRTVVPAPARRLASGG